MSQMPVGPTSPRLPQAAAKQGTSHEATLATARQTAISAKPAADAEREKQRVDFKHHLDAWAGDEPQDQALVEQILQGFDKGLTYMELTYSGVPPYVALEFGMNIATAPDEADTEFTPAGLEVETPEPLPEPSFAQRMSMKSFSGGLAPIPDLALQPLPQPKAQEQPTPAAVFHLPTQTEQSPKPRQPVRAAAPKLRGARPVEKLQLRAFSSPVRPDHLPFGSGAMKWHGNTFVPSDTFIRTTPEKGVDWGFAEKATGHSKDGNAVVMSVKPQDAPRFYRALAKWLGVKQPANPAGLLGLLSSRSTGAEAGRYSMEAMGAYLKQQGVKFEGG